MKIKVYLRGLILALATCCQLYADQPQNLVATDLITLSAPENKAQAFNERTKYKNDEISKQLPLFKAYPDLFNKLPHQSLGDFPTPVKKLARLEELFCFENIYIKQDSLSGALSEDGQEHIFGGNKVRKLEFLLADAIKSEAETVVTVGAAGSNHALATAVYSQLLGLDCIIMLTPQPNTSYTQRNLLLDLFYQPTIKAYASDAQRQVGMFNTSREYILDGKKSPYFVPMGGSNEIGVIGFINAAFELKEQIKNNEMPEPDLIYVTAGSCGTASGLILGIKLAGLKSKVMAVRISGTHESKVKLINELTKKTNEYLSQLDPSFPIFEIKENIDYEVVDGFSGEKYAEITVDCAAAIKLLRLSEKIQLDGTYTGKTFAAVVADIKKPKLKNKTVLFWNTYCSGDFEEITQNIDSKQLPELLQLYFRAPLQELDQGC